MADAKAKETEAEADAETEEGEGEQPKKSKFKLPALKLPSLSLKMMIIVGAGVLVLGGGGFAGWKFLMPHSAEHAEKDKPKPAIFVDLPDVLVNLANGGSDRTQYLKVKITLELPEQNVMTQIQPLMPRVVDAFQTYLRELRPTDLDGSAGLYRLKEELTRRVNIAVAPNRITAVLFKEIVVQ